MIRPFKETKVFRAARHGKSTSLIQQAIAILRRFGTNAHVYLPGIGTLSGLQAANYLDSVGTTAATVDSPVGLVLDAAGSLGVELVTNGTNLVTTAGWTQGASATISASGGQLSVTRSTNVNDAGYQTVTCVVGQTYQLGYTATGTLPIVTIATSANFGGTAIATSATTNGLFFVATSTTHFVGCGSQTNGATALFNNISVKQVTGIHATQGTTANKPILRQTAGKYSWSFDGGDSLSLGSVPFQMSDDHAVIAGARTDGVSAAKGDIYSQASTSAGNPLITLGVTSGGIPQAVWRDDAGVLVALTYGSSVVGVPTVTSLRKVGNTKILRINGVQRATNSTVLGAATFTSAAIGVRPIASPTNNHDGSTGPIIDIKGTLTDSEMLTLERMVANLTPNAPVF